RGIRYLLKQGHRKIALLAGSRKFWPARAMRAGALEALASHGIKPVFDWDRKWDVKSYHDICRQVLDSGATAYFTGGYPALWAANHFTSLGVRVPEDISILGLDDLNLKTDSGLKITSIGYDMHEQGRIAA